MHYLRLDSEIDPNALMLSRSLAQQRMVHNDDFNLPIVLMDSDILLNGSLEYVFEQDFDVTLTWRTSVNMPINGGLLILNNRRPDLARKFFDDFVSIYREKHIDGAGWYGDQLALSDVCGVTYREMQDRKLIDINGCKILFLPCDRYNFTPEDSYAAVMAPISNIVVLHLVVGTFKRRADFKKNAALLATWAQSRGVIFLNAGIQDVAGPVHYFSDMRHLSGEGAQHYSKWLGQQLAERLKLGKQGQPQ